MLVLKVTKYRGWLSLLLPEFALALNPICHPVNINPNSKLEQTLTVALHTLMSFDTIHLVQASKASVNAPQQHSMLSSYTPQQHVE